MARVLVTRHGSEGPRHDPYGWNEVVFQKTDGNIISCRIGGLGYGRITVNDALLLDGTDDEAHRVFSELTGIEFEDAEPLHERAILAKIPRAEHELYFAMRDFDAQMLRNAL